MPKENILPFYMIYPLPLAGQEEESMMRDLEYMQQLYPADAKKYQKKIAAVLDRIDYDGSLIYDEYPCRWQMYRLCQSVRKWCRFCCIMKCIKDGIRIKIR